MSSYQQSQAGRQRSGYVDYRLPKDMFDRQGAGLLNFKKNTEETLAALRHPTNGPISTTGHRLTKHLMDLGMDQITNIHKDDLVALTGRDLFDIASTIRLQHAVHNEAVEANEAQARRFDASRRTVRGPARPTETPAKNSLLAALSQQVSPTTLANIEELANKSSGKSSSSVEASAPDDDDPEVLLSTDPLIERKDNMARSKGSTFPSVSLAFMEDRRPPSDDPYGDPGAARQLFSTPQPPRNASKSVLVPGKYTEEAEWVKNVLFEKHTVPNKSMFESKTPFRGFNSSLDSEDDDLSSEDVTAHEKRVYMEMKRVAKKLEEDQFVWFKVFSKKQPTECIPETIVEREKRIYTWHLLQAVFRNQMGAFVMALRRHCFPPTSLARAVQRTF